MFFVGGVVFGEEVLKSLKIENQGALTHLGLCTFEIFPLKAALIVSWYAPVLQIRKLPRETRNTGEEPAILASYLHSLHLCIPLLLFRLYTLKLGCGPRP